VKFRRDTKHDEEGSVEQLTLKAFSNMSGLFPGMVATPYALDDTES
jgi:hypothetical protein